MTNALNSSGGEAIEHSAIFGEGDFELTIGQDISIGYLSHSETAVRLYLQESITFLLLTTEAAVSLALQT